MSTNPQRRVLIVHAHHEPKSFNGAMTQTAVETLTTAGHIVLVSDLYAMGFNPVSDRRNFTTMADADYLKQQDEETFAAQHDGFAPDVQAELDKLFWADTVIFQFPLWWFGLPAILKGWVDRVFACSKTYGGGRWYDKGVFVGKKAMCSLTVGGPASIYSEHGLNGSIDMILFPIQHGMFYFTGFDVIEPFIVHGPARIGDEARAAELKRYSARLLSLDKAPVIPFPKLDEYDENLVLKNR